jgi:hypothetical protein
VAEAAATHATQLRAHPAAWLTISPAGEAFSGSHRLSQINFLDELVTALDVKTDLRLPYQGGFFYSWI